MRCPNCGNPRIEYVDTFDSTTADDKHIDHCVGYCADCGVDVVWQEVYCFEGIENIEVRT